jgi:hypothetical protein
LFQEHSPEGASQCINDHKVVIQQSEELQIAGGHSIAERGAYVTVAGEGSQTGFQAAAGIRQMAASFPVLASASFGHISSGKFLVDDVLFIEQKLNPGAADILAATAYLQDMITLKENRLREQDVQVVQDVIDGAMVHRPWNSAKWTQFPQQEVS